MKILILHLTDMHFRGEKNWIFDKVDNIKNALKSDYANIDKAYLVLSGDISNSGKKDEFANAVTFLKQIYCALKEINHDVKIAMISTPGNHDCNFENDNQVRKNLLSKMNYKTLGDKDFSVVDSCISIQKEYWDFYSQFTTVPENKLFYQLTDTVRNKKICFNCFNTAWMSQIEEMAGTLFYPVKMVTNELNNSEFDLNISVFHHPIGWFNPSTEINNRKEFQDHLESVSNILIYGHEHEDEHKKITDGHNQKETYYISGQSLQDYNKIKASGFQTIIIDLALNEATVTNYSWSETNYLTKNKENTRLISVCP